MSVAYDHYPELHALVEQLSPEKAQEARRALLRLVESPLAEREAETAPEWEFDPDAPQVRSLSTIGILHGGPTLSADSKSILRRELGDATE